MVDKYTKNKNEGDVTTPASEIVKTMVIIG